MQFSAGECQDATVHFCQKLSARWKIVANADSRKDWRSQVLYRRRNRHCVTFVQNVLNRGITNQTTPKLPPREEIHHVVASQHKRVQVVVKLRAGIPAFDADHDSSRIPVAGLLSQLVLGDLWNEFPDQQLRGILNVSVGELVPCR